MKSCLLGLLFLGFTTLAQSQNDLAIVTPSLNSSAVNSKAKTLNSNYLKSSAKIYSAKRAKKLQKIAASYDIKKQDVYSPNRVGTYTVNFDETSNHIKAIYNNEGTLISAEETYNNIRLPYQISRRLTKDNPGWSFSKVQCKMNYTKGSDNTVIYHITMNNGNRSKTVYVKI